MFDSHAHYDDAAFDEDRHGLLNSLFSSGEVEGIVNAGCDMTSSKHSLELAERYPGVYAAVGIHPENADGLGDGLEDELAQLLSHKKAVAIGEIGLDYHYDTPDREVQKRVFIRQLEIAREHDMPVVIHDRDAHADCIAAALMFPSLRGVFHSYSGSAESAEMLIKHGWYISVGGVLTFKNARQLPEVVSKVPTERILVETDAPYLSPVPFRGKRNDSSLIRYTLERLADIKGISYADADAITRKNACELFGIKNI